MTFGMQLGTAIVQMSARTPAATAMAALTLDHLSGGRFNLGLGVSGPKWSSALAGHGHDELARPRPPRPDAPRRRAAGVTAAARAAAWAFAMAAALAAYGGTTDDGAPPRRPADQDEVTPMAMAPPTGLSG